MPSVLVVDDMALYRTVISRALQAAGFTVAGTASNGDLALGEIARLQPDLMTLDLEMPGLPGLDVLRAIQRLPASVRRPRIVVFSALSKEAAGLTMKALALGASDFVVKPTSADGMTAITERLVPALRALTPGTTALNPVPPRTPAATPITSIRSVGSQELALTQRRVLAIASSTGGPPALEKALSQLPAHFPVPVLVVQHMPPLFTRVMAEHLQKLCRLRIVEAENGMPVQPGTAYIAPGDWHMGVNDDGTAITTAQGERIFGLRPAADVLYPSLARAYGGRVLATVFTGMGCDGTAGARGLKASGAAVLTQTRETCVVYGMPAAVDEAGLSDGHFTPGTFANDIARFQLRW